MTAKKTSPPKPAKAKPAKATKAPPAKSPSVKPAKAPPKPAAKAPPKPAAKATPTPAPVDPPLVEIPQKLGKHDVRDILCQIEIVKDAHVFIARTQAEGAAPKEYRNTVFEDLLTEMLITLQEQLADK